MGDAGEWEYDAVLFLSSEGSVSDFRTLSKLLTPWKYVVEMNARSISWKTQEKGSSRVLRRHHSFPIVIAAASRLKIRFDSTNIFRQGRVGIVAKQDLRGGAASWPTRCFFLRLWVASILSATDSRFSAQERIAVDFLGEKRRLTTAWCDSGEMGLGAGNPVRVFIRN